SYTLLPLFYHCNPHHPDLHSFPTRRSSDLRTTSPSWIFGVRPTTFTMKNGMASPKRRSQAEPENRHRHPTRQSRPKAAMGQNPRDRKSTRLNSSHVKISYAVFCLKKKKTRH